MTSEHAPRIDWDLPEGWVAIDPPAEVLCAAALAEPPAGFGPNVQAIAIGSGGLGLADVRADLLTTFAPALYEGRLIDLVDAELDGRPALRVLTTFVGSSDVELTLEQWIAVDAGLQLVVSATCPTLDYHWHVPAIADLIASVEFDV